MIGDMNHNKKPQWSSDWAFIIAATGAAVGLGNIWRFPYMAGTHGGSAFVMLYLLCVLLIGLPIMMAEILIGRRAQANPITALSTLATESQRTRAWRAVGLWGGIALVLILAFYSVVAGWSVAYLVRALTHPLADRTTTAVTHTWQALTHSARHMVLWHSVFMLSTIYVVAKGVKKGLERTTRCVMPLLYLILFSLVAYSLYFGDAQSAVHFLFDFKWQAVTASTVIAAMGHAFFTLALGVGAMLAYGAYAPRSTHLVKAVALIALLDILVAFLSGLAIFPLVFAHHLSPGSGPGLMFLSLPIAFAHMPFGAAVAILFFLLLLCAAWTSSINLAEPVVMMLMDFCHLKRPQAAALVGLLSWSIGLISAFSFNLWQHVRWGHYSLFDLATNIPTDLFLPLGGLGFSLFAGWVMRTQYTQQEIPKPYYRLWQFLIRYLCPLAILIIFISGVYS
jgi:NSS family neurotransmitter:Na+ symporter